MAEDRFVFDCEWYDGQAALIRPFQLTFYPKDATIEMFDKKNRRMFLKRSEYASIGLDQIFLGATLNIYSRQLKVVDYADVYTQRVFEDKKSKTFALIKPDAYNHIGKIVDIIQKNDLVISKLQMIKMTPDIAAEQYAEHKGRDFYPRLVEHMTSDVSVAMELIGKNAVSKWRELCGPTNTQKAQQEAPHSLRGLFGTDGTRNAVHGSDSSASAARELGIFFPATPLPTTAIFNNCTLAVVKPHVCAKAMGQMIDKILGEGFEISAMRTWNLPKNVTEEFLEVYRGILPEYHQLVDEMSSGQALVLEIRQENAVESFRKLVGPLDPEIAAHLRPNTLRGQFGESRVQNAIHCTDLAEDGVLECTYFFDILYSR